MKKHLYYHIYLTDEYAKWAYPFMEQFKSMDDTGLLDEFDTININAISDRGMKLQNFASLLSTYNTKGNMELHVHDSLQKNDTELFRTLNQNTNAPTENVTMRHIYRDIHHKHGDDEAVLYLHSKGITSIDNHLSTGQVNTFKNYYYWRHFLNYGVIDKWKECVGAISAGFDIAGANYFTDPCPHFSGTVWWANTKYLKTLPDPEPLDWWEDIKRKTTDSWLKTAQERFRDEMWICSNPHHVVFQPVKNEKKRYLSAELLQRKEYAED